MSHDEPSLLTRYISPETIALTYIVERLGESPARFQAYATGILFALFVLGALVRLLQRFQKARAAAPAEPRPIAEPVIVPPELARLGAASSSERARWFFYIALLYFGSLLLLAVLMVVARAGAALPICSLATLETIGIVVALRTLGSWR